jgi:hypothetical protein
MLQNGAVRGRTFPFGFAVLLFASGDPLDRQTQTINPIGWNVTQFTSPTSIDSYDAVADITASTSCSSCRHTQTAFDSWGRKISERLLNNPTGTISTDTKYESNGRIECLAPKKCQAQNREALPTESPLLIGVGVTRQELLLILRSMFGEGLGKGWMHGRQANLQHYRFAAGIDTFETFR